MNKPNMLACRPLKWGLLSAALLGLGTAGAQTAPGALAGEWTVVGPGEVLGASGKAPTLKLDGRSALSGNAGCNLLSGRYAARGTVLLTSGLALTRRACDPQVMQAEDQLLRRLNRVTRFSLSGELLTLKGGQGEVLLRRRGPALNLSSPLLPAPQPQEDAMTPTQTQPTQTQPAEMPPAQSQPAEMPPAQSQPAPSEGAPAAAGHWAVRSLTVGGQPVPVPAGAAFDLDWPGQTLLPGQSLGLSGSLGCNRLKVAGEVQGNAEQLEWRPGGLASTRMACPPELSAAETGLSALLRTPLMVEQAGNRLTLHSEKGALVLERMASAQAATWAPGYQGKQLRLDGQDITLSPAATFRVEPQPDGSLRLSGEAGCNRLFGTGQLEDGGWTFAALGSTLMGCPPELAANEGRLTQLFSQPVRLMREGQNLTLRSGRGELRLSPQAADQPAENPAESGPGPRRN